MSERIAPGMAQGPPPGWRVTHHGVVAGLRAVVELWPDATVHTVGNQFRITKAPS